MPAISFGCKPFKLKSLVGIRARLILLALILVLPLMFDRVRGLEETRAGQIALAGSELSGVARHAADVQRDIVLRVQAILRSTAYIYGAAQDAAQGCAVLRATARVDLLWIRSLSVIDSDGIVRCSTASHVIGLNLGDRDYFRRALDTSTFVISDYIFSRATNQPSVMAAYPTTNPTTGKKAVAIAAIDMNWMSELLNRTLKRPGMSAVFVDGEGTVLAASSKNAGMIGKALKDTTLLDAVAIREAELSGTSGTMSFTTAGGESQIVTFASVKGTSGRMIASINEAKMLGDIDHSIRAAYGKFALIIICALIGAWVVAERLIVRPISVITDMAERVGAGDLSSRPLATPLPREFKPLARAFNRMAAQLAERERDLLATNNRLTVMASVDVISGLANRRGFQSRLDFEWLKAAQTGCAMSIVMIDVDHFKLFNDTYGHPEGDVCLGKVGEVLSAVAMKTSGFAARYGGEEFCLLLPNVDGKSALEIGELVRSEVEMLALPHSMSDFRRVTISGGIASITPSEGAHPETLVEAADAALYAAKHRGRNTVVAHALTRSESTPLSLAS
ncbi:MAG: diguanylate cyclase [Afipia sp.]|nr:diguanylate cyclase [Afipia sp.]OJW63166.1 MAG: GGDEF domain-containing protein [Afipia sp. 64-13]